MRRHLVFAHFVLVLGVALLKCNVKLKIDERFLLDSYVCEAYSPLLLSLSVLYVLCEHVSDS